MKNSIAAIFFTFFCRCCRLCMRMHRSTRTGSLKGSQFIKVPTYVCDGTHAPRCASASKK